MLNKTGKNCFVFGMITFLFLLCIPANAMAETIINTSNSTISQFTVWEQYGNPYTVTSDVIVEAGATLMIREGAVVNFDNGLSLNVFGTLAVSGTSSNPVIFTSKNPSSGSWGGIKLGTTEPLCTGNIEASYADISYADMGITINNSSDRVWLNNSIIHHNKTGISFNKYPDQIYSSIINCIMRNNTTGIYAKWDYSNDYPIFNTCSLYDNSLNLLVENFSYCWWYEQFGTLNVAYNWWGKDNKADISNTIKVADIPPGYCEPGSIPSSVKVNFEPFLISVPDFMADKTTVCPGDQIQFSDLYAGKSVKWEWDFDGDGNIDFTDLTKQSHTFTYKNPGFYSVKLVVYDENSKPHEILKKDYITVLPMEVDFSANKYSGEVPLTVQFATTKSVCVTSMKWDFNDDGTIDSNDFAPNSYPYNKEGVYSAKLIAQNETSQEQITKQQTITVYPSTSPDLVASNVQIPATASAGQKIEIGWTVTNSGKTKASGSFWEGSVYVGSFWYDSVYLSSDKSLKSPIYLGRVRNLSALDPEKSYTQKINFILPTDINIGSYYIAVFVDRSYSVDEGLGENDNNIAYSDTPIKILLPDLKADFTADRFAGVAPLTVQFTDQSSGNPTSRQWNFGDGKPDSQEPNPKHIFETPGTYTVSLTINNGTSQKKTITVTEAVTTSYLGEIISVSPQESDGSTNIQIKGHAVDRTTNQPMSNVPLNLVISLNGLERTIKVFTDNTGGFASTFFPSPTESGSYQVRAVHPDSTDKTVQSQFTIRRVIINPASINLNIPRSYEQKIDKISVSSGGLELHNLQLVYEAADQTGGVLPQGVHITTGSAVPLLSSGQSANFECTIWADNTAVQDGKIVLKVRSDEKSWGTVVINTYFSEAKPALFYTPDHIETGLKLDDAVNESIVLENKGLVPLNDVVLSIVRDDKTTPAPHWVHLNSKAEQGTMAVGDKRTIGISFTPNSVAKTDALAVAEGRYSFYLKVSSSNYPVTNIPLIVTVNQSGIGSVFFKVSDIYTDYLDTKTGQKQEGLAGAKIQLQKINLADGKVLSDESKITDAKGEVSFNNIPTGFYKYRVSANDHQENIGTIWIKPGITLIQEVFLAYNLVTIEWSVRETTIKDKYEIVLKPNYQTDVPAAVVVAEPASITLPDMNPGNVLNGEITFTNYGLLRADNLNFNFPKDDEFFQYKILTDSLPKSIEAKKSVKIPYQITCLKIWQGNTTARSKRDGGCGSYSDCGYVDYTSEASCGKKVTESVYYCATKTSCSSSDGFPPMVEHVSYLQGDPGVNNSDNEKGSSGSSGASTPVKGVTCPPDPKCPKEDNENQCGCKDSTVPTHSQVDILRGEYTDDATDFSVKISGHLLEVRRYYYDQIWHFNSFTESLQFTYGIGNIPKFIIKGGVKYKKDDDLGTVYSFDTNRKIFKETDGYRWRDSSGNWSLYDLKGRMLSYGDRNNQKVSFIYEPGDNGKLIGVKDNSEKQVLWYEYLGNNISAVKDADGRKVIYAYESGRLSKVTDVLGHDRTYTYDAQGRLYVKKDPEGNTDTITYNDSGYVASVTYHDGTTLLFDYAYDSVKEEYYSGVTYKDNVNQPRLREKWYNQKGDKIREKLNGKIVGEIIYEGRNKRITDANGNETYQEFDEWNNLLRETYPDGSSVSYEYEYKFNNRIKATDERGVVTKYEYDDAGNRIRKIEAYQTDNPRTTEYTYYPDGSLKTEKIVGDAVTPESVTTMEYDDNGNMISVTDAEGYKTTFTHNVMGQVRTKTDPKGKVWTYDYDDMGNLKSVTDPMGKITRYEYDKVGNKIKDTDPAGNITLYEYDYDRHLKKITDAYGNITQFVYTDGKLTKRIDPEGKAVTQEYDADGHLWKTIDGNGNIITYEYQNTTGTSCQSGCSGGAGSDVPTKVIYPTNFAKEFQYDKRGRKKIEKDIVGTDQYLTQFDYDFSGNMTSQTDKENHTTVYDYDKLGRKSKVTDANSGVTEYTYDDRNNLISLKDANGSVTHFEYDRNNRLKKEIRPMGQATAYEYDSAGSLIRKTDAKAQKTEYDYDDAGRMKTIRYYAASDSTPQKTVTFEYYPNGTLKSYADGMTSATYGYDNLNRKISEMVNYGDFQLAYGYAYYKNGLKKSFTMPDGTIYGYTYDNNNQLTGISIPGKGTIAYSAYKWNRPESVTLPGGVSKAFSYDPLMRLQTIAVKDSAQKMLMQYGYTYDKMNNIQAKQTEHGNYGFGYDPIYRLKTADNPGVNDEAYTYDSVGNRLTSAGIAGAWTYNANNELRAFDNNTYEYDNNGNMTQKSGNSEAFTYIYDVENRLVRVEKKADGSVIAEYYYDPFGRRLWKQVSGVKTYFLYADEGLIGEYDATGKEIKTYGYKPNSIWTTDPVFMKLGSGYYFYHNDHLGTPVQMTDGSGNTKWSATYDSFGKAQVGVETVVNNLRFPGQYFDAETGLYYNYFRYYDPSLGRYVEKDIITSLNLFVYSNNNPLQYIDPNGLDSFILYRPEFSKQATYFGGTKGAKTILIPDVSSLPAALSLLSDLCKCDFVIDELIIMVHSNERGIYLPGGGFSFTGRGTEGETYNKLDEILNLIPKCAKKVMLYGCNSSNVAKGIAEKTKVPVCGWSHGLCYKDSFLKSKTAAWIYDNGSYGTYGCWGDSYQGNFRCY